MPEDVEQAKADVEAALRGERQSPDIAALPAIVELKDIVNDILHDDRRAGEVIRRIRSLVTKAPFELKNLDLNDLVRDTVELLTSVAVARKVELD